MSALDRARAGILGLLIGDAMGVPYEFKEPTELPAFAQIDFNPPEGFERSHGSVPPGTWSDDGAQALCLLASLLECGRLDLPDFADRLCAWYNRGYLAVDNRCFDVGISTSAAIERLKSGVPPEKSGPAGEYSNGNGSLMRVLPLALWHPGSDAELVGDAHLQSLVTHAHPRSQACCALYCLWARNVWRRTTEPWSDALRALRDIYRTLPDHERELEFHIQPETFGKGEGDGYVVDCLRSAKWAFEQGPFPDVVRHAIALGHDTDTTACVAGGIAGLRDGLEAIPATWIEALRGMDVAGPLIDTLLRRIEFSLD